EPRGEGKAADGGGHSADERPPRYGSGSRALSIALASCHGGLLATRDPINDGRRASTPHPSWRPLTPHLPSGRVVDEGARPDGGEGQTVPRHRGPRLPPCPLRRPSCR